MFSTYHARRMLVTCARPEAALPFLGAASACSTHEPHSHIYCPTTWNPNIKTFLVLRHASLRHWFPFSASHHDEKKISPSPRTWTKVSMPSIALMLAGGDRINLMNWKGRPQRSPQKKKFCDLCKWKHAWLLRFPFNFQLCRASLDRPAHAK